MYFYASDRILIQYFPRNGRGEWPRQGNIQGTGEDYEGDDLIWIGLEKMKEGADLLSVMSVLMYPGRMVLTRTPKGPISVAKARVRPVGKTREVAFLESRYLYSKTLPMIFHKDLLAGYGCAGEKKNLPMMPAFDAA